MCVDIMWPNVEMMTECVIENKDVCSRAASSKVEEQSKYDSFVKPEETDPTSLRPPGRIHLLCVNVSAVCVNPLKLRLATFS